MLVARVLELQHQKDVTGHRLMLLMSKPRKPHKDEDPKQIYWFEDQDRLGRLYEYGQADTETERELFTRLSPLSPAEQKLWTLHIVVNQRGFCIDRNLAEAARKIAQAAAPEIDAELAEVTGGAVTSVNQVAKLQAWLAQNGCTVKDLQKKTVATLLETELPSSKVQRAFELRQDGGQSAVKKIGTLVQRAGEDGRVRGTLQFHKASTGRWAGEGVQPQNLKRPEVEDLEAAIAAVSTGDYEHVRSLYPRALSLLGDLGRSLIVAAPGHNLIGADFSAIEIPRARLGRRRTVEARCYARYDATQDPRDEPYCILACRILHVPDGTFTPGLAGAEDRQNRGSRLRLHGRRRRDREICAGPSSTKLSASKSRTSGAPRIRTIKTFWYEIDRAAWAAVRKRGSVVRCGPVAFRCVGAFLFLKLPSGRKLAYPVARIETDRAATRRRAVRRQRRRPLARLSRRPRRIRRNLDGKYCAGDQPRSAREAMQRVEAAGYPIVLHVHDEIVC